MWQLWAMQEGSLPEGRKYLVRRAPRIWEDIWQQNGVRKGRSTMRTSPRVGLKIDCCTLEQQGEQARRAWAPNSHTPSSCRLVVDHPHLLTLPVCQQLQFVKERRRRSRRRRRKAEMHQVAVAQPDSGAVCPTSIFSLLAATSQWSPLITLYSYIQNTPLTWEKSLLEHILAIPDFQRLLLFSIKKKHATIYDHFSGSATNKDPR